MDDLEQEENKREVQSFKQMKMLLLERAMDKDAFDLAERMVEGIQEEPEQTQQAQEEDVNPEQGLHKAKVAAQAVKTMSIVKGHTKRIEKDQPGTLQDEEHTQKEKRATYCGVQVIRKLLNWMEHTYERDDQSEDEQEEEMEEEESDESENDETAYEQKA